jgi:hypothetical protein
MFKLQVSLLEEVAARSLRHAGRQKNRWPKALIRLIFNLKDAGKMFKKYAHHLCHQY